MRADRRRVRVRRTLALARRGWRFLGDPGERPRRTELERFLLDELVRRPIVFEDGRGLRYVLYPGENAGVYLEHDGNYEIAETRFCERALGPGKVAFDVGANIGLYSLLFSRLVGEGGVVHAFEPEPANFRRLVVNLALNDARNVSARPLAVHARSGDVRLNVYDKRFNSWHSLGRPELPDPFRAGALVEPTGELDVAAVSLDDYCTSEDVARIDLLKVDVEGAELDVLEGARRLLEAGSVGLVLFEVSLPQIASLGRKPTEIFTFLAGHGFRSFGLDEHGRPADEVESASSSYANYVATPGTAELAALA